MKNRNPWKKTKGTRVITKGPLHSDLKDSHNEEYLGSYESISNIDWFRMSNSFVDHPWEKMEERLRGNPYECLQTITEWGDERTTLNWDDKTGLFNWWSYTPIPEGGREEEGMNSNEVN